MKDIVLEFQPRESTGSSACRRYRRDGWIPSVVYSHGEKTISALVSQKAFVQAASTSKSSQLFTIKGLSDGVDGRSAVVKEVQRDFIKGNVLHVDFQALKDNEEVSIAIAVKFVGEATGVKNEGGILSVMAHEMTVSCLPRLIPDEFVVDVSHLAIGDSIHAQDIPLPEGVSLDGDPEETLVSVVAVRVVAETTPETAGEGGAEAAEGGEADAAAGDKGEKKE